MPPPNQGWSSSLNVPLTRTTALTIIAQQFIVASTPNRRFTNTLGTPAQFKNGPRNHVRSVHTFKKSDRIVKGRGRCGRCGRCGKKVAGLNSLLPHLKAGLALRCGKCGRCGRFFEKTFPPPQISDSPNLIQPNSMPGYLHPHARGNPGVECIPIVFMFHGAGGNRHGQLL